MTDTGSIIIALSYASSLLMNTTSVNQSSIFNTTDSYDDYLHDLTGTYQLTDNTVYDQFADEQYSDLLSCCKPMYLIRDTEFNETKKNRNLQSVENLRKFEEDWNGYGAGSFSAELCDFMEKIIKNLDEEYQPKLFPTGRESIQIEYEKTNGEYLEIEVFSSRRIELFQITADGKEIEKNIGYDEIERAVKTFYGV
jgi:hypothetical protein